MRSAIVKVPTYFYHGFMQLVSNSGYILVAASVLSLVLSNIGGVNIAFLSLLHHPIVTHIPIVTVEFVVNDVLMTLFFSIIAIELKYELTQGALNTVKLAALPVFAAIGGMLIPAAIYYSINVGTTTQHGWGIPMATDIVFALALYNLFGTSLPPYLKIILSALAVVDDFGAILVIALLYNSGTLSLMFLLALACIVVLLIVISQKIKVPSLVYFVCIIALWFILFKLGIHPTMSAVLVGLIAPYQLTSSWIKPLHKWVYYCIVPLFALVNTAIIIDLASLKTYLTSTVVWGVTLGLVLGKPLGITLGVYISNKCKLAHLPVGVTLKHIALIGVLGGVGFTVSLFVSTLAFNTTPVYLTHARIAILVAGLLTVLLGKIANKLTHKL
jgi:Na+:H+ antiporter, NhaA family